ncbi:hypothetical protein R3P38DRAFT_2656979 [Favolaschia claudopus]|uniref:F-box domain-containing protein n=1 Tax=Favolaschia claudopus TaxID=2862362 RepID=A0AAV9ZVL7_9AGAR
MESRSRDSACVMVQAGSPLPTVSGLLEPLLSQSPVGRYEAELSSAGKLDRLSSGTFASQATTCRSVLSPVHRLPNELLLRIFECCRPDAYKKLSPVSPAEEVDCISHRHLLHLAQVSSLWHLIVMEAPKLWSNIVLNATLWEQCDLPAETLLDLLEVALNRGQDHDLKLKVAIIPEYAESLLKLLTKHAHRWRNAHIGSRAGFESGNYLSNATGRLARLEKLQLVGWWKDAEAFQTAPVLTEVTLAGSVKRLPPLPWAQIQKCTYRAGKSSRSAYLALAALALAPSTTAFTFDLNFLESEADEGWDFEITSDVPRIAFTLTVDNAATVGQLFDCLTLPSLQSLSLYHAVHTMTPVWCTEQFLCLADRSGFAQNLKRLSIHVEVSDVDLLRSLEVLPRLEDLVLMDCPDVEAVVTDSLLQALIHVPDVPCLLPHLRFLCLRTVLAFTDSVYTDFVVSRVHSLCTVDGHGSFKAYLWWRSEQKRAAPWQMIKELRKLVSQGVLIFDYGQG